MISSGDDVLKAGLILLDSSRAASSAWPGGAWRDGVGENALVAIADWDASDKFNASNHEDKCLMVMNISAFWDPGSALDYSLQMLSNSNMDESVRIQGVWLDKFAEATGPVQISGAGTEVYVSLINDEELEINYMTEFHVGRGQRRSIADMFEISLEHDVTERPEGRVFNIDGVFNATGLAVATGRSLQARTMSHAQEGLDLMRDIVDLGATIEISENLVRSFTIGGKNRIVDLSRTVGMDIGGLEVLEMAIGTNRAVLESMDPTINAQINEGVLGYHLGLGEGMTGAHLDFLCPFDWTETTK